VVAGMAAIGLATLVWTNHITVWIVLGFSFVTGCCMALAGPSYQAMTFDLVGREDLANAVALNSSQFQLSRVIGPVAAGLGLKFFGLAGCFYLNGISFVAVIMSLRMVRFEGPPKFTAHSVKDRSALWQDLLDGIRYVRRRPRVSSLLTISAVNSLFGAPYLTLIPVFARDIFKLGPTGLAWMMGTAGAGAFLIAFGLSTHLPLSLIFLFGVGFAIVTSVAVTNTLLQKLVTDEMRGRVMSMFILSFIGAMPIGNLLAGVVSHRYGAPFTLAAGGVCIVLYATVMALRNKRLRELH
jgi:MFS family permease